MLAPEAITPLYATYHITNRFGENVHDLRLTILHCILASYLSPWDGIAYMSFGPIEERVRALIKDNEGNIEYRSYLVRPGASKSVSDRLVDTVQIILVIPISPGERRDDGLLIKDPHPQLIHHDELRDLLDFACAVLAALHVCLCPGFEIRQKAHIRGASRGDIYQCPAHCQCKSHFFSSQGRHLNQDAFVPFGFLGELCS